MGCLLVNINYKEAIKLKFMVTKKNGCYIQDRYMGVPIKCNASYPVVTRILEALYVMVYKGSTLYSRVRGFHVRFRFTDRMDCRTFSARLSTYYRRKSAYTPMRITVAEYDDGEKSLHYHMAILLDDRKDTKASLQHFMARLFDSGFVKDYKVISPARDTKGYRLGGLSDLDGFFEWMTYLAKTATKVNGVQSWAPCRALSVLIRHWVDNKQPDLRLQFNGSLGDQTESSLMSYV